MLKKKTAGIVTILFVVLAVFCLFSASSPVFSYKILLDTPLYGDIGFDAEQVLKEIKRNETVDVIGEVTTDLEGREWVRIRYNADYEGYVPYAYLYKSAGTEDFDMKVVKVTGKSTSEKVPLYSYYDEASEVVATLVDGEKLDLIVDGNSYGEFSKVVYNGKTCFVKTEKTTTGLTYNQRLALIISAALIAGLLFVGIAVVLVIRKKKREGKNA